MTKITLDIRVYELVTQYPKALDCMVELGFKDIVKPGMLQTAGRVMTLRKGIAMKKIEVIKMIEVFKTIDLELEA